MIKIYNYGEVSNEEIFARDNIATNVEGIVSDIIANVISDLNLQFDYRKKDFLKWRGQYPASDLSVACSPLYLDTLTRPVSIEVKVRDDNYVVKVKYGKRQSSKHVVSNLSESIETCAGILSLDINNAKALETGNQYRIKIYPLTTAVNIYRNKVHVSAAKKDSKIIYLLKRRLKL